MSYQDRKALRKAVVEAAARCFRAQHSFDDEDVQRLLRDIGRNLKLALSATDAAPPNPGWTRRLRAIWVDGPDSEAARAGRGDGRERLHGRTIDEWHAELVRLDDAAFEALSAPGWPEWEIALRKGLESEGR